MDTSIPIPPVLWLHRFCSLTIPHATTDHYDSASRNYPPGFGRYNWDRKMDIISAQLSRNRDADHWIIENRASNMQSLSSSDFGSPIRINSYVKALDGSYPYCIRLP